MPIPDEIRAAIIRDGAEGRLSLDEIAAKHLGDKKKAGTVSKILKKAGQKRPNGRKAWKHKPFQPNLSSHESEPINEIEMERYDSQKRLDLIDKALTHLESKLNLVSHPKGLSDWTSALDRLLDQRRAEDPVTPVDIEDDGFMQALETKTSEVWADAPDIPVQVDSSKRSPMENFNMVGDGLTD